MKIRQRLLVSLVGVLVLPLLTLTASAGEAFAPRAEMPAGMEDTALGRDLAAVVVPDKARVGVPAYPGAVVIRSFATGERPPGYEGLPVVEMISAEDYETVIAFYRQRLPTWEPAELLSAYYFAIHGNINFFKPEEPHVGVHRLEAYYRESEREMLQRVLPGAKTLIKVFFAQH